MTRARTPCSASDALGWLCEPVSASIYLSIYISIYISIYSHTRALRKQRYRPLPLFLISCFLHLSRPVCGPSRRSLISFKCRRAAAGAATRTAVASATRR